MKKTIVSIILATLLLVASGSTSLQVGGSDPLPPFCPNGGNCD